MNSIDNVSVNAAEVPPTSTDAGEKGVTISAIKLACIGFSAIFFVFGMVHLLCGRFTGDEGWYALAARNVMEGQVPYRDFLFWQMPLAPYVYALWFKLIGPSVEAGRMLSLVFGMAGLCCAVIAAYRRAGLWAAMAAGILISLSLHYVFDAVSFKTQPLTIALTGAAILVLARRNSPAPVRQMTLAMAWVSLAFLSRLSLLPAVLLLWAYALWVCRKQWPLMAALVAANAVVLGTIGRFFWADGNMLFNVYQTHQVYFGNPPWSLDRLLFHFLKNWGAYELAILFCFVWSAIFLVGRVWRAGLRAAVEDGEILFDLYLFVTYAAVTFLHMVNAQNHPGHQTSIILFAVVFGVTGLARFLEGHGEPIRRFVLVSLLLLAGLNMPAEEWDVHFDGRGSMGRLAEVRNAILKFAQADDSVLSFHAELAVNSDLKSVPGYDMSEFSYYPEMDDAKAAKLHAANARKLLEDIQSGRARIFCASDLTLNGMSAGSPELAQQLAAAINGTYRKVARFDQYGQFYENMNVWVRKEQQAEKVEKAESAP